MTIPAKYTNIYIPVKYFLTSYRALSDGRSGISYLEEKLSSPETFYVYQWKILWIGTCSLLRTAIDLFRVDARSCLDARLREEITAEWKAIGDERDVHAIFWKFLRHERDKVLHEYEWRAYEAWIKPDGTVRPTRLPLLLMSEDDAKPVLLIKSGPYKGRNALELLKEAADWVETRIFSAIRRAGFDPEEERNLVHFQPRPKLTASATILGNVLSDNSTKPNER